MTIIPTGRTSPSGSRRAASGAASRPAPAGARVPPARGNRLLDGARPRHSPAARVGRASGSDYRMTAAGPSPHVSVIMPVFNAGRFLAQALSSVEAQTYHDLELVIV